ncbi:MAG: TIGR04084 family radical SAM/SPASM domain-containing protein [Candidatus Pacearchaeota archaeon]|jgi:putative peptide-modifying radical SAM enzyme
MHYHIILTEKCNSKCKYCYEKSLKEFNNELDKKFKFNFSSPEDSQVNIKKLKEFIEKDKEAVIVFYGGEPLLQIPKIIEIIDNINVPFRMQTNGKLLNELPSKYVNKIEKILISLDGNKERTDLNRGDGTYDLVMKNIELIKKNGYNGELIARMTICFADLYDQVLNLIDAGFSSVHWQLDAGFYKFDFDEKDFKMFTKRYNESITRLINYWVTEMYDGKVLKFYPLLAIANSILNNEPTKLRCGAGHSGYAITTDGKIVACPIMNCIEDFYAGNLDSSPEKLKKFDVSGACEKCDYQSLCGGRCLYWNKAELWPKQGNDLICDTIKHLINETKRIMPEIQSLIAKGIITESNFNYEKYFGPEIIP